MNDFETLSGVFFRKVTVKPLKNYNFSYTLCSVLIQTYFLYMVLIILKSGFSKPSKYSNQHDDNQI